MRAVYLMPSRVCSRVAGLIVPPSTKRAAVGIQRRSSIPFDTCFIQRTSSRINGLVLRKGLTNHATQDWSEQLLSLRFRLN